MKLTLAPIKFFNGEKENPFKCKDQNKIMLGITKEAALLQKVKNFLSMNTTAM